MHRPVIARAALLLGLLACATSQLAAQRTRAQSFVDDCNRGGGRDEVFCETRAVTIAAATNLRVDGRQNGGITVHAWDNAQFQVVAMVQARAGTQADAQGVARAINVTATNGEIRADGPQTDNGDQSWSVSYEVWAPRHTALDLKAMNGGISVDGVDAQMSLETVNGGLSLSDIDGDVHGTTTNGGINVDLSGSAWRGAGLDLRTTNGGVHLTLPAAYSAHLLTSTVNGNLDLGIPVTIQGKMNRRLEADLGSGGATINATTMNGGVSITRK